jgi:hypothetical protein
VLLRHLLVQVKASGIRKGAQVSLRLARGHNSVDCVDLVRLHLKVLIYAASRGYRLLKAGPVPGL